MDRKTIIVGGGMAGMACALQLLQAGQDFALITDELGGRIRYSPEAGVNYGAYFVMGNYAHARQLLTRARWINPLDVRFYNSERQHFTALSLHTLGMLGEFVRFYLALGKFSRHYEHFKKHCLTGSQQKALTADPYMAAIFQMPAAQFIREHRFERAAADYIGKFAYACTGANPEELTALDFLNVSMGLMVPIHQFKFDRQAMAEKLDDHLVIDTITDVENRGGRHFLKGKSGTTYSAENLVMATPAGVTKELLDLGEIRGASQIFVYHVKAELRPSYRTNGINLFPPASPMMLTARQFDGSYLIYGSRKEIDLNQVCERYEVLGSCVWEKAMYVYGKATMAQQYGESVYVAGDHNGLGLEPTALTGIYAANRIIARTGGSTVRSGRKGALP